MIKLTETQTTIPLAGAPRPDTITTLRAPDGATMKAIIAVTGWLPHTERGVMSAFLGKKLGLIVTSVMKGGRARAYRINLGLA